MTWSDAAEPLLDHPTGTFKPLITRIDGKDIDKVVEGHRGPRTAAPDAHY